VLRGIGMGGWLMPEGYMLKVPGHGSPTTIRELAVDVAGEAGADRYVALYRETYVREEDVAALAAWGYDHVRLPFHYAVLWDEEAGAFDEGGFALVDRFLGWCRTYGLPVILDMHAAPGGQSPHNIADAHGTAALWVGPEAQANQDLTVHIWEEIARRYRDDRNVVGYDFINEPVLPEGVTRPDLRAFYVRLRDAVRAIDPHHVLFIEGDFFANFFDGLAPAFDDNMVWAFHKYWSPTDPADMARFIELRDTTGVPLWLGETGENSNDWFHEVATWAVENGIGWNWWTHKKIETVTSPLSAPMRPGYRDLIAYWRGEGPKPDRATAEAALLAQAAALHIDSTTFRPDVLWALFDPAWDTLAVPYRPHTLPGAIDAVDYDLGADGVGYHDTRSKNEQGTPGLANEGGVYRNDGVDIVAHEGPGGPAYRVGWTEAGEWLQYTVTVPEAGRYAASVTVWAPEAGGRLALTVDGKLWGEAAAPASPGRWTVLDLGERAVPAGVHVLRLWIREGGADIGRLSVVDPSG
jgi:endoglucanase